MNQIKGIVTRVIQCSGCLAVTVVGEEPGTFIIDNCCVWSIVDAEGANWIGRRVEYQDGRMRFLDRARPESRKRRRVKRNKPNRSRVRSESET